MKKKIVYYNNLPCEVLAYLPNNKKAIRLYPELDGSIYEEDNYQDLIVKSSEVREDLIEPSKELKALNEELDLKRTKANSEIGQLTLSTMEAIKDEKEMLVKQVERLKEILKKSLPLYDIINLLEDDYNYIIYDDYASMHVMTREEFIEDNRDIRFEVSILNGEVRFYKDINDGHPFFHIVKCFPSKVELFKYLDETINETNISKLRDRGSNNGITLYKSLGYTNCFITKYNEELTKLKAIDIEKQVEQKKKDIKNLEVLLEGLNK